MDILFEHVYETVMGQLEEGAAVPGVRNVFEPGQSCDVLYGQVQEAYGRLTERLGAGSEDPDVEIILENLLKICKTVAFEMYRCGERAATRG